MRLLIIGDLYGQLGTASAIARSRGAKVGHVEDLDGAMVALRSGQGADLIMIEVKQDIEKLVTMLVRERFNLPVVACGVQSDKEAAVRAIKAGAKEYIPLPPNEDLIAAVLEAITEEPRSVIYQAPVMQRVIQVADQIAQSDASVLITGESGTGKEVIARYIHSKSKRASQTMVSVNCAAIPENLLESELFGHEKGAFTGAVARRIGKFEEADGGTMFLDEISEMDLKLQAKLLRVLQEREIDRVGGSKPVKVNIRVLATSNRNLPDEVKAGRFREDLYYRLNVITLELPPLRDRKEDIPLLAQHFVRKYSDANGVAMRPLTDGALQKLLGYVWPGNVRELENVVRQALLLARGFAIGPEQLRRVLAQPRQSVALGGGQTLSSSIAGLVAAARAGELEGIHARILEEVERELFSQAILAAAGNQAKAARWLGVSRVTMREKLNYFGLREAQGNELG